MASEPSRGIPLPVRILIGLAAGVVLGVGGREVLSPERLAWIVANIARPVGGIFLNMMFMVVIPLVFSSLALGVAGLGDLRTVGRLGLKILAGTVVLTAISVAIGIGLVNVLRPGEGLNPEARARLIEQTATADVAKKITQSKAAKPFSQVVIDSVSKNPIEDAANLFTPNPSYAGGGLISFLIFTIIVGLAMTALPEERAKPIRDLLESIQSLSMVIIGFAMKLAPFGVAGLIMTTTATVGLELFRILALYVVCVIGGLAIQIFVTYSIALSVVARRSPMQFFKQVQEVIITAFSTASSNATLPTTLRVAQEKVGLPKAISSFVLTVGATGNQNGTALFEGVTVLFLAQFYGINLSFDMQVTVVLMSVLAGVGTAGVPGGSIPLIAIVLETVGIPAAGIGIILGVDRLLDMCRTVANVVGDIVLTTLVSPRSPSPGEIK